MNDQARARDRALTLIWAAAIAQLVWVVIWPLAFAFGARSGAFRHIQLALSTVGIAIDVAALVGWMNALRAIPRERASLVKAVIALVCLQIFFSISMELANLGGMGGAIIARLWSALYIAEMLVCWFAVLRFADGGTVRRVRGLTRSVIAVLVLRALIMIAREVLFARRGDLGMANLGFALAGFQWAQTAGTVGYYVMLLFLVRRLRGLPVDAAGTVEPSEAPSPESPGPDPEADIFWGSIFLAGGVLVSAGSYFLVQQGGGGRYVVTTGLIAVGIGRLIRGFARR